MHSTLDKLYGTTFRAFYFSAHQIASSSIARFNQFQFQYGLVLVEKVFFYLNTKFETRLGHCKNITLQKWGHIRYFSEIGRHFSCPGNCSNGRPPRLVVNVALILLNF